MKRLAISALLTAAVSVQSIALAYGGPEQASARNPEDHPPKGVTRLTHFGERASWSPDGTQIAFMSKSFGDAFVVDVKTRRIELLTHYPNAGYLRVQYLPNGDFLLVGARKFEDVRKTRYFDQELWLLKSDLRNRPIALDQKLTEGIAVSRSRMKIAYAVDSRTHPGEVKAGEAIIYTANVAYDGGQARLTDRREAVRVGQLKCVGTEPQDFRNDDRELVFVCYRLAPAGLLADIYGVDLQTGAITTYRKLDKEYNEVEGMFPNGKYTLVESSRDQSTSTSKTIDIWKLRLEPNGTDMVRLTRWGDYPGYKASNPVVSPDGKSIAFQSGHSGDEAGVGYGIFLMKQK